MLLTFHVNELVRANSALDNYFPVACALNLQPVKYAHNSRTVCTAWLRLWKTEATRAAVFRHLRRLLNDEAYHRLVPVKSPPNAFVDLKGHQLSFNPSSVTQPVWFIRGTTSLLKTMSYIYILCRIYTT